MSTRNGHRTLDDGFEAKLRRLGDRWRSILDSPGDCGYAGESEADMALIDALVKRRWSDDEIWRALECSPRLVDRIQRKGEKHARDLYAREIVKARAIITPFPPDEERPAPRPQGRTRGPVPSATTPARPPMPAARSAIPPWKPSTGAESFITEYVAYASERTDAPPEAHELMAVGILSALVGPDLRLPIAATVGGWKLNLWALYIVNSTVGRKSTVINLARDILERSLGERALIQWEGSPQGFIQRLQDRDHQSAVFLRDEYSGLMQQMNRGGHMSGLIQLLIRAFDGGIIENIRVRKKSATTGKVEEDTDRVTDPYLVTLAASTRDSFVERATIDNVLDGFLARFIVVAGHAEPRPFSKVTARMLAVRDELVERAVLFHDKANGYAELDIPDRVIAAAWEIEQRWIKEAEATGHPGAAAAAFKRLSEACLKIAALIAIDEHDLPRIELEHYQTAIRLGERWKANMLELIEELGQSDFRKQARRISETLARHPDGITRGELFRIHRSLKKREFDELIEALIDQGDADELAPERSEQGGRPTTIILPTDRLIAELQRGP